MNSPPASLSGGRVAARQGDQVARERKSNFIGGTTAGGAVIAPATPNFTMPDYTLVDLRAGVQFDRYAVSVYASNLFDEYAFQNASTLAPTFGTATILRPRRIGAVLSVEF